MRLIDLTIIVFLVIVTVLGLLTLSEIRKNPEVKYVVTEKVVQINPLPTLATPSQKSSTVSGKVK